MDSIGWSSATELDASTTTATHAVTAGVGKLTLYATDTLKIEFSDSTTDIVHASNSMQLPANAAITIDVPTLKFPILTRSGRVSKSTKCYLQFQTATNSKKLKIVEH